MKKILYIFPLIILLLSCNQNKTEYIKVYTELPEVMLYIETFNNQNENIKILPLSDGDINSCDIVIFKGDKFSSPVSTIDLSNMFIEEIDKELFYYDIINSVGNNLGEVKLLPLSFDLSGLIYNKENRFENNVLKIDDFINDGTSKFSPFWDTDFIIWYYLSLLPELNQENNYLDNTELNITANTILNFRSNKLKNWDIEKTNKKYLYQSPELLIHKKTIDYYFYTLSDYVKIDRYEYPNINFSLLSSNDLLPVNEELVYIGINEKSSNKHSAKKVLAWMFNPDNQRNYIINSLANEDIYTLFTGGLSTLKNINNLYLVDIYPFLEGLLPREDKIIVTTVIPHQWSSLKEEVYKPIFTELESSDKDETLQLYSGLYKDWYKKHNK